MSKEVEGKVIESQAQANCSGGDEILLEKVGVMVCFEDLMWQFSETWIFVAKSRWIISDVAFLLMMGDVYIFGEYTR